MDVGRVVELARYPVKSMGGETLAAVEVGPRGLTGDRGWAVCTSDGGIGSGKTTRRFRRIDGLLDHSASLGDGSPPVITLASGARHACGADGTDDAVSAALGRAVTVRPEGGVPHHDESPVHLITTASLRALDRLLGGAVDARRLRPNVLLDVPGDGFVEDDWIGRELRVGDVVLALGPLMPRCVMVDAPQAGVPTEPRLLVPLGRLHGTDLGIQASVLRGGVLRVGDVARLV